MTPTECYYPGCINTESILIRSHQVCKDHAESFYIQDEARRSSSSLPFKIFLWLVLIGLTAILPHFWGAMLVLAVLIYLTGDNL